MTVQQARTLLGPDVLIGRSIHDLAGALRAEADGADYLLAGHVFATGSKPDQPGRGVEWIADLAGNVSVPIIAIGGITRERTEAVLQAGAYGVAMGREILAASDPTAVAREIRSRIEQRGA